MNDTLCKKSEENELNAIPKYRRIKILCGAYFYKKGQHIKAMKKISTDKRLQLVRAIRLQNQYDRQLFRSRQQLLYDSSPAKGVSFRKGEINSPETDLPLSDTERSHYQEGEPFVSGFKIRLMIAMVLLAAFVFCDNRQIAIQGTTTQELFEKMTESMEFPLWERFTQ